MSSTTSKKEKIILDGAKKKAEEIVVSELRERGWTLKNAKQNEALWAEAQQYYRNLTQAIVNESKDVKSRTSMDVTQGLFVLRYALDKDLKWKTLEKRKVDKPEKQESKKAGENNVKNNNQEIEKVWDKNTQNKIKSLDPKIQLKTAQFINQIEEKLGIKLRITHGYRSIEEQNKLYEQGRTKTGDKVTNAKGGSSYHNYGLAFDVVEIKDGKAIWDNPKWDEIAKIGKELGFEWGGDFKSIVDKPHFQMTDGKSIKDLKKEHGIH